MIGGSCQASPTGGFVSGVLGYIDCQAQAIGLGGYQALSAPGSTASILLGALLTIFVALFGYRMLLGHSPGIRDGVLAVAKVGIVLTLAFSWPAYRTLFYDLVLKAPAELAAAVGRPAGLPGSDGGLVARLDNADRAYVALTLLGTGFGPPAWGDPSQVGAAGRQAPSTFDPLAFGTARIVYLTSAVGTLAGLRLIAGLMLALGPLFAGFLLFESTRGLFEGCIRVLAATALGAIGTGIVLGVQLALLEPWLIELITWRNVGYSIPGAPVELLALSLVFAIANLAVVIAAWRVTVGFGFPTSWRAAPRRLAEAFSHHDVRTSPPIPQVAPPAANDRSRAAAIAEAVAAGQQRDEARLSVVGGTPTRVAAPHDSGPGTHEFHQQPLGQSARRTRNRLSASAGRRDRIK